MSKTFRIYGYYQPSENKWYVGRTSEKYQSARAGKEGKRYLDKCPKFAEAIRKHGWGSFEYHVFETTEDEELSWELEKKWVDLKDSYNNGYNLASGGKGSPDVPISQERRDRMSMMNSLCHGHYLSKGVQQFTKDGRFIAEYSSLGEASRKTGIPRSTIWRSMRRDSTCREYRWKYI